VQLREREIEPRVRVTDAEVDAFIREQTGARGRARVNLAMILVEVPEAPAPTTWPSCKSAPTRLPRRPRRRRLRQAGGRIL
jgi:peptidyl-prolyl cis-trans isomerase SurA